MEIVVGGEKLYSQNLRDFLRIKEEDHRRNLNQSTSSSNGSSSRLTLSAILSDKISQPPPPEEPLRRVESNRTLLDVIREDQTISLGRGRGDSRRSWRHLKDKLRLRRRRGAANNRHHHSFRSADSGESTQPDSRAPIPLRNPRRSTESASERFEPSISPPRRQSTTEETRNASVNEEGNGSPPEQPVRMSLMALLAENDRQMGYESYAYVMGEEETEKDVKEESAVGVELEKCCVCMVRHKGAAFIPCGHTFCRLCSRELWVQRGNCPLCNNFIAEILDIF